MKLSGKTGVLAILGDPVDHSLSPAMQNAALQEAGVDAIYVPFHVAPENLGQAVAGLRALGILGANVTVPHKERVCRFLDQIDPEAQQIGAVNTIVNRDGRLIGYNTDGQGLLRSLREDLGFSPAGKRILLLGAGGACRAALVALCGAGAAWVGVANRTVGRASELAGQVRPHYSGTEIEVSDLEFAPGSVFAPLLGEVDLVVNGTSIGLGGKDVPPLPWQLLPDTVLVYDMVYGREATPLVRLARDKGLRCADGLGMLVGQGELAFALWTGHGPSYGVMRGRILAECAGK